MNIAALLALLLNSGMCAKTDFQPPGGGTLRVVVCPMVLAPAEDGATPKAPPAPPPRPELQAAR
jgi:hypothetical protein